jgi:hypothetical protein
MIKTPHLIASYRLERISGGITPDSSGNGNNGTVYGASIVPAVFGNGLSFDGIDDRVDLPDAVRPTKDFTLSHWVYPRAYVLGHCAVSLSGKGVLSFYPSGTNVRFYVNNGSYYYIERPQSEFPVNNWYHITQTYDGVNIKLYVNGVYIASEPCTGDIVYDIRANSIGSYYYDGFSFDSIIDEVYIFSKAISASDIKRLYLNLHPLNG